MSRRGTFGLQNRPGNSQAVPVPHSVVRHRPCPSVPSVSLGSLRVPRRPRPSESVASLTRLSTSPRLGANPDVLPHSSTSRVPRSHFWFTPNFPPCCGVRDCCRDCAHNSRSELPASNWRGRRQVRITCHYH